MRTLQFTTLNLFQSQLHKAERKGQEERVQRCTQGNEVNYNRRSVLIKVKDTNDTTDL